MSFIASIKATGRSRTIGPTDPMPFGKHKGIPIDQIPRDYLVWALKNMDACRPDHERYWPEFTAVLESLVGPQAPVTPAVIPIIPFCHRIVQEGITLRIEGLHVVASEDLDEDLERALSSHQGLLRMVLSCVDPDGLAIATGQKKPGAKSAKLFLTAEVRNLIKDWYKKISRRFHPDMGGSNQAQSAINQSYQILMSDFDQWEQKS